MEDKRVRAATPEKITNITSCRRKEICHFPRKFFQFLLELIYSVKQVEQLAGLEGICLRTGAFCNPGAVQEYLQLSGEDLTAFLSEGKVCGDDKCVIRGKPTGAIRVSFGYMSRVRDVEALLVFLQKYFISSGPAISAMSSGLQGQVVEEDVVLTEIRLFPIKSCAAQVCSASESASVCDFSNAVVALKCFILRVSLYLYVCVFVCVHSVRALGCATGLRHTTLQVIYQTALLQSDLSNCLAAEYDACVRLCECCPYSQDFTD